MTKEKMIKAGNRLRKFRIYLQLSVEEMAERMGVSALDYERFEAGECEIDLKGLANFSDDPWFSLDYIFLGKHTKDRCVELAFGRMSQDKLDKLMQECGINGENIDAIELEKNAEFIGKLCALGTRDYNTGEFVREIIPVTVFTEAFEELVARTATVY